MIGDVDLTGDDTESHVAVRLRALEARISESPAVAGAVLSLSAPDEPSLAVRPGFAVEYGRVGRAATGRAPASATLG